VAPTPNPQSPIPNPQSPIPINEFLLKKNILNILLIKLNRINYDCSTKFKKIKNI
jgi:hypothetical protein